MPGVLNRIISTGPRRRINGLSFSKKFLKKYYQKNKTEEGKTSPQHFICPKNCAYQKSPKTVKIINSASSLKIPLPHLLANFNKRLSHYKGEQISATTIQN
ncbi:hypothetical protein PEDI_47260 [Persicobacter diffluens]|uniref:Uncharacterized protein n=1 Tax=Persicobacter diffluens TaxID=981 RepID=A0AAN4W3E6_9BACT|nr:hypothetical protein PEDI_47260 [Persicobacter diffluens]